MGIKRFVPLFIVGLLLIGCSGPPTTPSEESVIEGTVIFFPGGGALEIQHLPGFILYDYQWITPPPDSTHGFIYLLGRVDSSYINKHVQAEGKVSSSTFYSTFVMDADTLEVVN